MFARKTFTGAPPGTKRLDVQYTGLEQAKMEW